MQAKGYSLWLMPTGEAYDKFSNLIKRLAKEYNAPIFEPHVTLIGEAMQSEEDVIRRAEKLVSGQESFPITLRTIDCQDSYFRTRTSVHGAQSSSYFSKRKTRLLILWIKANN